MLGALKNMILIFLILTAIYAALTFIGRMRATDKIRGDYIAQNPDMTEDDFIETGLAKYQKSLRRKLIVGVYLVPLFFAGVLIYLAQYG